MRTGTTDRTTTNVGYVGTTTISTRNILPLTTNTYDIGSSALKYKTIYSNGAQISGLTASNLVSTDGSNNLKSLSTPLGSLVGGGSSGVATAFSLNVSNGISRSLSGSNYNLSMTQNLDTDGTPSFASQTLTADSNQLVLGPPAGNTATISADSKSWSGIRTLSLPDPGNDASFVMTEGVQTINGDKKLSGSTTITNSDCLLYFNSGDVNVRTALAMEQGVNGPSVVTIPNETFLGGGDAFLICSTSNNGAQSITGGLSVDFFSGNVKLVASNLQFTTAGPRNIYIASGGAAADRTYTLPDAAANGNFVISTRGSVTQTTGINSAVTCNGSSGRIVTVSATTAADTVDSFVLNNNYISAASIVMLTLQNYSGTLETNGYPVLSVSGVGSGSCTINIANQHPMNALDGVLTIGFLIG